ncbi:hypothetical protein DXG03_000222 [Asterophora parasitica]|uniref:C2H2-type domain-containing protein n=1 Tax=Asterophora parasitica TaxID=117018 RepID=A0A9P7GHW1_9AGAR|nr:hypothetical protein DXG03_000222 [Asterophora parasitica]
MTATTVDNDKIFACEECDSSFKRKGDLTRHAHVHTGYKPHICGDCGKGFAQFSGLKTHRNSHTKIKPHACPIDGCGAAFGDPSSCTRHIKETHRVLGHYVCPVARCPSKIKRRSAFTKHLRKHNIDPESVDIDSLAPPILPKPEPYAKRLQVVQRKKSGERPSTPVTKPATNGHAIDIEYTYPNGISCAAYGLKAAGLTDWTLVHQLEAELPTYGLGGSPANEWSDLPPYPGLYTFDAPSPLMNPGLSHSASPSPSPLRSYLQTPTPSRVYTPSPSTPAHSYSPSPPLYSHTPESNHAVQTQKFMRDWELANAEANMFRELEGLHF